VPRGGVKLLSVVFDCLLDLSENLGNAPPPGPTMDDLFGPMDFLLPVSYDDDDKATMDRDLDDYLGLRTNYAVTTPLFSFDSPIGDSTYFDVPCSSPNSSTESWKDFSSGDTESDCSHNVDTPEDTSSPGVAVQDHIFKTWYSSQADAGWKVFGKFLANASGSAAEDKDDSYNQSVLDYLLSSPHDQVPIHSIVSF